MKDPKPIPSSDPVKFATSDVADAVWPVKTSNSRKFELNYRATDNTDVGGSPGRQFLATRIGGKRYHVAVDLFADHRDKVVACENGRIVSFYTFYPTSTGEEAYALIIEHEDFVINYGEVKGSAQQEFNWRIGDRVTKGQEIARISTTEMLHFETYILGTSHNERWMVGGARPNRLLNPTLYLLNLAAADEGLRRRRGKGERALTEGSGTSAFVRAVALTNPRRVEYFDGNNCKQTKTGGSRSWRNNNPGNIVCGQFTNTHGAIGCDRNTKPTAAIFPSMDVGRAAQIALLQTKPYQNLTVGGAMDKWSGKPNNTDYQACVKKGSGIAMDRSMTSLSDAELAALTKAMQHCEGFKEGTINEIECP